MRILCSSLSFFVLLLPVTVFAWSGDGHQIVCLIAEERLTPETKAAIHELLGEMPPRFLHRMRLKH
jgi:hypothetical protein